MLNKRFSNLIDCIRLLFRKDKESYSCFYKMLGFYPRNISYYEQALLHKSLSAKNEKGRPCNNERLEFLGDAILDAIIADILYQKFDGKREGFLTNTRSKIVSRETLNHLADQIGLTKLIKFSTRQAAHNSYMGGNAFEALVGAMYLEKGYKFTRRIIIDRLVNTYMDVDALATSDWNFKSKLIDWGQKERKKVSFEVVQVIAGHRKQYETRVLIDGAPHESAIEFSIKAAEQLAAEKTYKKMFSTPK